jgi:hypothetical protein
LCSDHYVSVYYSYVYILQIHFLKFNTCVFPENFICFLSLCRNRILQQYHMSSISAQLKSHLRRSCEEELPRDQKYVLRVPIFFLYFFPALFSYYSCSTSSTSTMATGSDRRSRHSKGGPPARVLRWRNIRLSGAFSPEVTL